MRLSEYEDWQREDAEREIARLKAELAQVIAERDLYRARTIHWNECPCNCPGPRTTAEEHRATLARQS